MPDDDYHMTPEALALLIGLKPSPERPRHYIVENVPDEEQPEAIAQTNDIFRNTLIGGRVYITQGIQSFPEEDRAKIVERVRTFRDFKKGDDPHGERDFGWFMFDAEKIYWKIDYYEDDQMEAGAEDPLDPKTYRVLTIMLASEY
jgi:hypothetical protein